MIQTFGAPHVTRSLALSQTSIIRSSSERISTQRSGMRDGYRSMGAGSAGVSRILCKHFRDLMLQPGYVNCAYPRVASQPVQPCDVVCFSGGRAQQHFTNEV